MLRFFGQFQVPDDSALKLCSSPLMVDVVSQPQKRRN
jgi:hypothetical protein